MPAPLALYESVPCLGNSSRQVSALWQRRRDANQLSASSGNREERQRSQVRHTYATQVLTSRESSSISPVVSSLSAKTWNLEGAFHSLPNTPASTGFPSPFCVPSPLTASAACFPSSPRMDCTQLEKASSPLTRSGSLDGANNGRSHAEQVATEVALSALDLDESFDDLRISAAGFSYHLEDPSPAARRRSAPTVTPRMARDSRPQCNSWSLSTSLTANNACADGMSGVVCDGDFTSEDQPRRKGRARMSQEKRRRLARRREREAALTTLSFSPSVDAHYSTVPHSAPPYMTSFRDAADYQSTPPVEWLESFPARHHTSPLIGHGFHDFPRHISASSSAPSLSPSGSSVGSPFDHAFEAAETSRANAPATIPPHVVNSSTLPSAAFDRASYVIRPNSRVTATPGAPPKVRVVVQPPTPQEIAQVSRQFASQFHLQQHQLHRELSQSKQRPFSPMLLHQITDTDESYQDEHVGRPFIGLRPSLY